MAPDVRPFRFETLERWTRSQLAVFNTLHAYLPSSPFSAGFKDRLRRALEPYVNCDIDIWLDSMSPQSAEELLGSMQNPTLVAVIGFPPETFKVFLEFDLALAAMSVERVLGGKGVEVDASAKLTEIEQGVFAFLVLKALALLRGEWGDESPIAIKLEALRSAPEELTDQVKQSAEYFNIGFKFFFDLSVGFARLSIPKEMMTSSALPGSTEEGPVRRRRRQYMRERWARLDGVRTSLVAEAGRCELTPQDVDDLEVGDIILLEETGLALVGDQLSGSVTARVGEGTHGSAVGALLTDPSGRLQLQIERLISVGEPESGGDEDDEDEYEDDDDDDEEEEDDAHPASGRQTMTTRQRAARVRRGAAAQGVTLARAEAEESVEADDASSAPGFLDDDVDEPLDGTLHDDDDDDEYEDDEDDEDEDEDEEEEDDEDEDEDEEEEAGHGEPDNLAEAEGLLGDISVPLVVEIGRVRMSATDVVNLRTGQVLELRRSPHDPVDLVVQNRFIGKGELVEVDGALGVRLISLAK